MARSTAKMPKGGEETGLTDKQLQFCRNYARSFNARESYIKAGYAATNQDNKGGSSSADVQSYRLLRNPKVQAYLAGVLDVDEAKIVTAVSAIALCPITEIIKWDGAELLVKQSDQWSERAKLAVKKITTKQTYDPRTGALASSTTSVELHDRLSALDKLMKMLSMYPSGQQQDTHIENPSGEVATSYAVLDNSPAGQFFRGITGTSLSAAALPTEVDGRSITVED